MARPPEYVGTDSFARRFFVLELDRAEDWPQVLDVGSPSFVLFLACDAARIGIEALSGLGERVLSQGAAYVCAWGPDCTRVDDLFDELDVIHGIETAEGGRGVLMTTWHEEDSLGEALEFFRHARPDEARAPGCTVWIAASIGMPEAATGIRQWLAGLAGSRTPQ